MEMEVVECSGADWKKNVSDRSDDSRGALADGAPDGARADVEEGREGTVEEGDTVGWYGRRLI